MKTCTKCGSTGPFYVRGDGYELIVCKTCQAAYQRQYKEANRERLHAYNVADWQREKARKAEARQTREAQMTDVERAERRAQQATKRAVSRERQKQTKAAWEQRNRARLTAQRQAWEAANKEAIQARQREYYQRNCEAIKEAVRQYRQANPEKKRLSSRRHYEANREHSIEVSRRWAREHPEQVRANGRNRSYRKRSAGGTPMSLAEWEQIKIQYDHRCLMCGRQEPEIALTVDHVVPLVMGGSVDASNVQPLCFPCNARKQANAWDFRKTVPSVQLGFFA